jgi:mono/diheme cytochrome c family protein
MSKSVIALATLTFVAPVLTFAADLSVGRREYEHNCVICHGDTGRGDGWLAKSLTQPVPSLAQLKKNYGGVFPVDHLHRVIDGREEVGPHGPRHMLPWGQVYFLEAQREGIQGEIGLGHRAYDVDEVVLAKILALIDYIATLQA